jgi:hypothetical protein
MQVPLTLCTDFPLHSFQGLLYRDVWKMYGTTVDRIDNRSNSVGYRGVDKGSTVKL